MPRLSSSQALSLQLKNMGIFEWKETLDYIHHLPYGRNTQRDDWSLVLTEGKGTCSSKHALLKAVADENKIKDVDLILGLYKMNKKNTPAIGDLLATFPVSYIPEAHCYLKINGKRTDLTFPEKNFSIQPEDIIEEIVIEPSQVVIFKPDYHKKYLQYWITSNGLPLTFDQIWEKRESCISRLANEE